MLVSMGDIGGAVFSRDPGEPPVEKRKEELVGRLRRGPGESARQKMGFPEGVLPSRWRLRTIRATVDWLPDYTLSGLWRLLNRLGLNLRPGRVQQYSPDPDYAEKETRLLECLEESARCPGEIVALFLDEMGYYRWPEAASGWGPVAPAERPVAQRQESKQKQWRIVGVLNALTGQVNYLDDYIVGRKKVGQMYEQIDEIYPSAQRIYVVQDNWSIHTHDDVLEVVDDLPRVEPVWLPTYAPWLNPIEKLWRWLKEDVLKLHRWAGDWSKLRGQVNGFLDQFGEGSEILLQYVGLKGEGKLAQATHPT